MKRRNLQGAGTSRKGGAPGAKSIKANFTSPSTERNAAIDRIITAVGKEPDDRNKLAEDIYAAHTAYIKMLSGQDARKQLTLARKQLTLARKGLENFLKLGASNSTIKEIAEPHKIPELVSALHSHEIELHSHEVELLKLHNFKKQVRQRRARERLPKSREAAKPELLAGIYLPRVYRRRFGGNDAWSRDAARVPKGPIIDFIEATLDSLNLSRGRHWIGTALYRTRKSRHLVFRPWGLPPEWEEWK
jgi:hypothetical protein